MSIGVGGCLECELGQLSAVVRQRRLISNDLAGSGLIADIAGSVTRSLRMPRESSKRFSTNLTMTGSASSGMPETNVF